MSHLSSSGRLAAAMERTSRLVQAQSQSETETGVSPKLPRPALTIAVSREAGANGALVARAVEQQLGWPVYDRELLQRVAEHMGLRASLLEAVDEKRKGWFQECL